MTDVVVTSIDLAREPSAIQGRLFRLRKLTVQPGGIVPWHSHGDRPALITIVSGEIVEYVHGRRGRSGHDDLADPAGDGLHEINLALARRRDRQVGGHPRA